MTNLILPDSRVVKEDARIKSRIGNIPTQQGKASKIFCMNCGADGGMVRDDWFYYVMYLCDKCSEKYGRPGELMEIPENTVRPEEPK